MNMSSKTNCPACGSQIISTDRRINSIKKDRSLEGLTYIDCSKCGTVFNMNNVSSDDLTTYHAEQWHSSGFFAYGERSRVNQVEQLKMLMLGVIDTCQIGKGREHLDLGSGEGGLCNAMHQLGFKTTGIEPSESAVLTAKKAYPEIDFVQGAIERDLSNYKKFNLITLLDVIEHVSDPEKVLSELVNHLEEDGAVVVRLPISQTFQLDHLSEYANFFMPPFHNTLFSKSGLKILCKKTGLEIFHEFPTINAFGYTKSLAEKLGMLVDYKDWRKSEKFKKFDMEIDNWFEKLAENAGKPQTLFCALKISK